MSKNQASILVIDDQVDNLRTLSEILKKRGYRVRQATSGEMALKTATSQPPDLILLDIRMPQMDGYSVCAALKESPETREIPVIFLSALGDVSDKVKAFNIGGVDYITKPFQVGEVLARISNQLSMRQQQQQISDLLQQVQQLNTSLEQRVQAQTLELQQALQYERTLKYISDRVRDSLDKTYILQAAVEELSRVLQVQCCDTVLYNPDQTTEIFCFQADSSRPEQYDAIPSLSGLPGIHEQLERRETVAFCRLANDNKTPYSAILGCPIQDDRTWVGTLWLFKSVSSSFSEQEIRLVQQVANQCAIALRQARLYQEAQAQIVSLHRLNQLKDDFLSTISHELRTPVSNMQMVLQLLMIATEEGSTFLNQIAESTSENNRIVRYFKILQEECERELHLIQDLLDLQQLEAEVRPLKLISIDLNTWIRHVLESYELKTQSQQQRLSMQLAPDLPLLTTDLSCLNRIVVELLDNACKYTPVHESIVVSTEATVSHMLISVSNSGIEIAPDELPHIFERFYRIPNNDPWKHGGTGLGLALVQRLIQHLSGSIQVSSGNGWTRFILQLPLFP